MKALLLITSLMLVSSCRTNDVVSIKQQWAILGKHRAGVYIAKLQCAEGVVYAFFPAGDRVRPTSTLFPLSSENTFSSLKKAVLFLRQKPASEVVMEAGSAGVIDDAKVLLPISINEKQALGLPD